MKIELNISDRKKVRLYLDHFNAALRSKMKAYRGSAGYLDDGSFKSSVTGEFPVGDENIVLTWTISKTKEGALEKIDVNSVDQNIDEDNWCNTVNEFITSIWSTAFSEKCQTFFRRHFFHYIGQQLDGEYWLPGFRFAPAYPEDSEPMLINAERVVSIDMNVSAIDEKHAISLASERAERHAARLSLLLNVGLYKPESVLCWVLQKSKQDSSLRSERYQLGFSRVGKIKCMPKKEELCGLGRYEGSLEARYIVAGSLLSLPHKTRKILRGIDQIHPAMTEAIDRCAQLYRVALVDRFPSVCLAYRIAAVEALAKCSSEFKGFSDFVRKNVKSRSNLDNLLDVLYGSVRSAHFHGGEFPMGEYSIQRFFDPIMDSSLIDQSNLARLNNELTREAIITWLYKTIPEIEEVKE